ncbi:Flp pilus assembly protein CpaB [Nocardioides sp. SYSU D00038]|uniref:Flp pilus assembly protein CpaB n=1 Tax=Nocardioides sp. SYSU D00038 TaxID=2812554 RepID=UPI0019679716|nr:Flp pilus assembly protein CpaB [Nocardioides sp. SYSU D00038]
MDRRRILLIVAVLVAALGAALVFLYVKDADTRANERFDTVEVLRAQAIIEAGETIEDAQAAGKLKLEDVSQEQLLAGAQTTTTGLAGMVALQTLYPGEQILAEKFGAAGSSVTSNLQIPDDRAAVSVNLTDPGRVAGFVTPGSEVAIYYSVPGDFTRMLLPRVKVLGVGATTPVSTTTTDESGAAVTEEVSRTLLTLALDQTESEKVIYASLNGEVTFALLTDKSRTGPADSRRFANLW